MAGELLFDEEIAQELRRNPRYSPAAKVELMEDGTVRGTALDLSTERFGQLSGHFGIVPGVFSTQLAMDSANMLIRRLPEAQGKVAQPVVLDKMAYKGLIHIGDPFTAEMKIDAIEGDEVKASGWVLGKDGEKAVTGAMTFELVDADEYFDREESALVAAAKVRERDPILLSKAGIEQRVLHRDPFLLVEEINRIKVEGKTVDFSEELYGYADSRGYGDPFMPPLLAIEAGAQPGAMLVRMMEPDPSKFVVLMSIQHADLGRVHFGSKMETDLEVSVWRGGQGRGQERVITPSGLLVASAALSFATVDENIIFPNGIPRR